MSFGVFVLWIDLFVEPSAYAESGFCRGAANAGEHCAQGSQGLASPIDADLAEQTVFNRIPFGSSGGIVTDRQRQAAPIGKLLKGSFELTSAMSVAAAAIGEEQ